MEGYLHLKIAPWLRRLTTRVLALVPAVLVISLTGEDSTQNLLVLSQVVLSLQLAFAVIPLIQFTSNKRNMGAFATPWWARILAWLVAAIIVTLNGKLVLDQMNTWVEQARESTYHLGPIPLEWIVAGTLYGLAASMALLLLWITIKPFVRPSPAWAPAPTVQLDWVDALRPRSLSRVGVALEHNPADAEIMSRALGLIQADPSATELVLIHVVDSPVTRFLGADTADRETGADERYLIDLVQGLRDQGYRAEFVLLHGPDPAGRIVSHLREEPVDLLVVGSHGHGLVRDILYGQTVDRVRHNLEIPMLIARPGGREPAVAGEESHPDRQAEEAGLS
jgi:manganese transport protein